MFDNGLGKRSENILMKLREEIASGVFAPDTRFPTEHELCARFGVSRTTVRSAIARLRRENLITVRRRAGMTVNPPPSDSIEARTIGVMGMHEEGFLLKAQPFALENDYRMDVFYQDEVAWNVKLERLFLERVRKARYRLLLALCTPRLPGNLDLLSELRDRGVRIIHLEYYSDQLPEGEYLLPDYRKAGFGGAVELQLAGYERLCYVGFGENESPWARLVEAGFAEALELHAGGYNRETAFFDFPRRWSAEFFAASQERLNQWIATLQPGTGLCCRNQAMAERLLAVLVEQGRRVPDEIGLVCVDAFNGSATQPIHALSFDMPAIKMRALRLGLENGSPVHELAPPRIRRGETVRRRGAATPSAGREPAGQEPCACT